MSAIASSPPSGLRILRFLSAGPASLRPCASAGKVMLESAGRGSIAVDAEVLAMFASRDIVVRTTHSVALSAQGSALAQQALEAKRRAAAQGEIDLAAVDTASGPSVALANAAESPLAQLARRKGRDGRHFLTAAEYEAGERLRADYTRGRIMPRLSANWEASVSSGRRGSIGGGVDLTDAALAARQRVEAAIEAVGPELSGVLIDVCCFLKGLERVEAERAWPVRSAKIVLKTALGALARHYAPREKTHADRRLLHWGAEDYRPSID